MVAWPCAWQGVTSPAIPSKDVPERHGESVRVQHGHVHQGHRADGADADHPLAHLHWVISVDEFIAPQRPTWRSASRPSSMSSRATSRSSMSLASLPPSCHPVMESKDLRVAMVFCCSKTARRPFASSLPAGGRCEPLAACSCVKQKWVVRTSVPIP